MFQKESLNISFRGFGKTKKKQKRDIKSSLSMETLKSIYFAFKQYLLHGER